MSKSVNGLWPPVKPAGPKRLELDELLLDLADQRRRTRCADDPDLWVSENPAERAHAAVLCGGCELKSACLAAGREGKEFGVYGGVDITTTRAKDKSA